MDLIVQKGGRDRSCGKSRRSSPGARLSILIKESGNKRRQNGNRSRSKAAKQSGPKLAAASERAAKAEGFLSDAGNFDLRLIGSLQPDAIHLKKILGDYTDQHRDRPKSV